MRIFEKFNKETKCEICGTNEDKPCVLIPILGTEKDNIARADIVHVDCLNLIIDKDNPEKKIIYQLIEKEKKKSES